MSTALYAFVGDRKVARLSHDAGRIALQYEAWEPALSARLPVREAPYGEECRSFLANLLPEGAWRNALCRQLGIAHDDDYALLASIGADCAGAVSLHADPDWRPQDGRYVETSVEELRQWVKTPAKRPSVEAAGGLRLSLAGAQDKLLIHIDDGVPFLCEDGAPSTVILKPDMVDSFSEVELSALNELYCSSLAAAVGLSVPTTAWFASAFATWRYDRQRADGRWHRLHQEDFAQLLGRGPAEKYGIQWRDCFELVTRHASTPARARVDLIDRLLFNLLIGNLDAHGKDFALLHQADGELVLAPAYDLLCTQLDPTLSRKLAMPIGEAETAEALTQEAWRAFAAEVGVTLPFLRKRAVDMIAAIDDTVDEVSHQIETTETTLVHDIHPARRRFEVYDGIRGVVADNRRLLARSIALKR